MMRSVSLRALSLSTAVSLFAAFPAAAQVALTAHSVEARVYDGVASWHERGFRPAGVIEMVQVPGSILLDLRAVFDGPWNDDIARLSVNARDIQLVLPDGTALPSVGHYSVWGQMTLMSHSISGSRPRNFPTDDSDLYWNGLFVVPKGIASATLRIGGAEAQFETIVQMPAPSLPQDAAAFATFEPRAVRRFRVAQLEDGRNESRITSMIAAPQGTVLAEVEVAVSGVASNQLDGSDRFSWSTSDFRLVDAQGATLGLVGERFMHRILDSQFNGIAIGQSTNRTMVWVVPEGLNEARLFYGETEVARVSLGSAPVTQTD